MGAVLLDGIYLYVALGVLTAVAFVTFGVTRAFDHRTTVTIPARILLLPAAIMLWPLVLFRWLGSGKTR